MCKTVQIPVFVDTIVVLQTRVGGGQGPFLGPGIQANRHSDNTVELFMMNPIPQSTSRGPDGRPKLFVTNITNDCAARHRGIVSIHAKYVPAR
jgi:hypothetical protein